MKPTHSYLKHLDFKALTKTRFHTSSTDTSQGTKTVGKTVPEQYQEYQPCLDVPVSQHLLPAFEILKLCPHGQEQPHATPLHSQLLKNSSIKFISPARTNPS